MDLFVDYSLFFLQNIFVLFSSWIFVRFLSAKRQYSLIYQMMLFFVIWSFIILLPQQILGFFGQLHYKYLWIFHFLIFLCSIVLLWRHRFVLSSVHSNLRVKVRSFWVEIMFFLPLAILLFVRFINALQEVPVEYDNLAYHLPFVVEWMRTGDLMQLYYSAFAGPISYYPSNFELIDLFVMLPFKGDLLVNLLNFPLIVLNGVAFYGVLSLLSIKRRLSLVVTALFLTTPLMLRQVGVPLVDLYFNLAFLSSLYFLFIYLKSKDSFVLYPFAASLGLFVGTKYLGLVYAAPLLAVAIVAFLYFNKFKLKVFCLEAVKVFLLVCLGGGFWYFRNWLNVGNPIYPAAVEVFGKTIFTGYAPINDNLAGFSLFANLDSWSKWTEFFDKFTSMVSFNSFLFLVSLVVLVALIFRDVIKKHIRDQLWVKIGLLAGFFTYFLLYLKSPYSFNNLIPNVRYALMAICLGFFALAYVLNLLKKKCSRFVVFCLWILLVLGLYFFVFYPPSFILNNDRILFDWDQLFSSVDLMFKVMILLVLTFVLFFLRVRISKNQLISTAFVIGLIFVSGFAILNKSTLLRENSDIRTSLYQRWYGDYPAWHNILLAAEWFNRPDLNEAKIAYTGFNFHYPFLGRELNREVDYVNINNCTECRYGDFAKLALTIRSNSNYEEWLYNLKNLGKEYVVVEPKITDTVYNYEYEWMTQHKDSFKEVFVAGSVYIFKIL